MTPRLGDRSLFPDLEAQAYLNHAAISPPSLPVKSAVERVLFDYARRGVGAVGDWFAERDSLREKIAKLVGGTADQVGLTPNTTRGVTDIALCFPWQPKDRVLLLRGEFPANVTPWQRAAELFELEIDWLDASLFRENPEAALSQLDSALRRGVRLCAVSWVQFQTGHRLPIQAISERCHNNGAEIFVDAIQGLGAIPFSAPDVDYLTCGSQKWLMGMEGAGFIHVKKAAAEALRPHVAGWLSHENPLQFLFEGRGHLHYDRPIVRSPRLVEGGAMNVLGFAALSAAVDTLLALTPEAIFPHITDYLDRLEPELIGRGFTSLRSPDLSGRSGILSVFPPSDVSVIELHERLGARGISCSTPDGHLRFAPHYPNHADEVPLILKATDQALTELRS